MRYQGYANVGTVDEQESSAVTTIERDPTLNPAIYCDCSDLPSLTRQEFAEEADINNLMARYEASGILPTVNKAPGEYLDVSDVPDFQTALDFVARATEAFMTLPARARATFENSPAQFIRYAEDPANADQMRAWGLREPLPPEPAVTRVEVINPAPEPAKAP